MRICRPGGWSPDEYGDRVAKVSVARTREDLEVLFVDLPEPHPLSGRAAGDHRGAPGPRAAPSPVA